MSEHDKEQKSSGWLYKFLVKPVEFSIPIGSGKEIYVNVTNGLLGCITVPSTLYFLDKYF